jgi:hypothetical protein
VSKLEATFRNYLALDAGLPLVLALWTLATQVFDCFDAFPYLAVTSPTKRCGKTRLAEIIEHLAANTLRTVGITPAALFRSIQLATLEGESLTLIIDEAEALRTRSDRSAALLEILNAGYRSGQCVRRCERDSEGHFELRDFNTYCPKVLVLIGELPETLADRCIPVRMRRAGPKDMLQRFRYARARYHVRPFLKDIAKWAEASKTRVKRYYRTHGLEFLKDREEELWLPLFSVCAVAAPERLKELEVVAGQLAAVKASAEGTEIGVTLLKDIRDVFDRMQEGRITSSTLVYELVHIADGPWQSWSRGRGLEPRSLARLLRPFRVEPHNLRLEDQIVKGYERSDFTEAWARYLAPEASATPLQGA